MKHIYKLTIIPLLLCFAIQSPAVTLPPDRLAGEYWMQLGAFLEKYPRERYLTDDFADAILAAAKLDSAHNRCVAAYAAAYIKTDAADDVLATLAKDPTVIVAEVAQMAIVLRSTLSLSKEERFGVLCYELSKERGIYFKIFLINYIGRKYSDRISPLFLRALAEHQDRGIRYELLCHLVDSGAVATRAELIAILEKEPYYCHSEYLSFALGCITQGRSKSGKQNNPNALLQRLEKQKNIPEE